MWSNFHNHSDYCDGKGPLTGFVSAAGTSRMTALGFSSHAPLPFACGWCMKGDRLPAYLDEIDQLKSQTGIPLYKSLEVDFIPGIISPANFNDQLDYTIGSVHFVDAFPDGRQWEIDGTHSSFLDGLNAIFHGEIRSAVRRYFELTREMVMTGGLDIVGHLDKIKIQNVGEKYFQESDPWYRGEVIQTLQVIRQSGVIVEVNTRGLYQKKSATSYPSPWILELLHQQAIPVTLSSDAHHPDDLTSRFPETAAQLLQIGFKRISTLIDGCWQSVPFNENGIVLEHHRI